MPYAMIHGLRIFYKDVGEGRPLVLIPGLGADSTAYNALLPPLRRRMRVIAPDPRGLGRSGDALGPLSTRQLADDLRGLLAHLEIPRARFLGTSLGAAVALRFAALYPDHVDRLVLCSAGRGQGPYARRVRRLLKALVEGTPPQELMGHLFTLILSPQFIEHNEGFLRELEEVLRPDQKRLRIMARQLAMMEAEAQEVMEAPRVPVLIMAGALDRLTPMHHAAALHKSLPGSRLLVLDEAGHHPFLETFEAAVGALLDFLMEES